MTDKKIIFMGTPEISTKYLEVLIKNNFNIIAVYTQPPRKSGRGMKITFTPVHKMALTNKIPIMCTENFNSYKDIAKFKKFKPDIVIVMGYGLLLPKKILDFPKFGCINIHVSLLPRWRGASPIEHALINGDKKTGVSIFKLEEKLDTGAILSNQEILIDSNINKEELTTKLNLIGINLLLKTLPDYFKNNLSPVNQDNTKATYAGKISNEMRKINFNDDVINVYNFIRAFSPNPAAWFNINNERIKILKCTMEVCDSSPNTILNDSFHLGCKGGKIIPKILQRAGKKPILIQDFLRGFDFLVNNKVNA